MSFMGHKERVMGEASRRKQHDPNYGKVPKSAALRGLVVSPPVTIEGTSLFVRSSNLDPQELRFALLFWDRLVWPASRAFHFASGPDEIFLEQAGVLARPDYTYNGDAAQGIARGQIQAYLDLDRREPGSWALAQGENTLLLKENLLEVGKGALIELHRAIPIPQHDVPLAEILEFKERRRDELLLLRAKLESLVSTIKDSSDNQSDLQRTIAELDHACSDLLQVGKEWQFPVHLSNLKTAFSLTPGKLIPAAIAGWKTAEPYGLTAATITAGVAGAVSTIEVKGDFGFRPIKRPVNPYRYAYSINRELR